MIRSLAIIAGLLALAACARSGPPAPVVTGAAGETAPRSAASTSGGVVSYVVQRGDTLYAIARRFNVPLRRVIELNDFDPPYTLLVGQRVRVPVVAIHIVRSGETLSEIAGRYDLGLAELAVANGIQAPYVIYVGQEIRLPRAVIAATSSSAAPPPRSSSSSQSQAPSQASAPPAPAPRPQPAPVDAASVVTEPSQASAQSLPVPRTKPIDQASRAVPAPAPRSGKLLDWPITGRILSEFGPKPGGLRNDGINIAAPRGAKVTAAENGVVAYAGDDIRAYGNLLLVKHADGLMTAYAHLERFLVKRGDKVKRGQLIGTVGSSGAVTIPQLHFEVRKKSDPVDPRGFLPRLTAMAR
ncbi:MAG: M23 family metallopeptidase [Rhodospirillales bacterium]